MKGKCRPEEEWARQVIEQILQRPVVCNDVGTESGMYDLRIGPKDAPEDAIEVTGAVNESFVKVWNTFEDKGPVRLSSLRGEWFLSITAVPKNRKSFYRQLEPILRMAENQGLLNFHVGSGIKNWSREMYQTLNNLKVVFASCIMSGKGTVDLKGWLEDEDNASQQPLVAWVGAFLRRESKQDVLDKLQRSGAPRHHVFIIPSLGGVPHAVESYMIFGNETLPLPLDAPDLPPPVTNVWVATKKRGLYWDGISWQNFEPPSEEVP